MSRSARLTAEKLWLFDRAAYMRLQRRVRFYSKGLNSLGKPLRIRKRPELAGLPRLEYMRRYRQLAKAGTPNAARFAWSSRRKSEPGKPAGPRI